MFLGDDLHILKPTLKKKVPGISLAEPEREIASCEIAVHVLDDPLVNPVTVDEHRDQIAADGDGQSVPSAIRQPIRKHLDVDDVLVRVVQSDLVLPRTALKLQKPIVSFRKCYDAAGVLLFLL